MFNNKEKLKENTEKAFLKIRKLSNKQIRKKLDNIIDEIYNGNMPKGNQVVLKNVPINIRLLGVHNNPILISPREIRNAILSKIDAISLGYPTGKNENYHNLGKILFYKVLDNLNNPLLVIKEKYNKIIIFTEQFDYKNNQIIEPIEINTNSDYNSLEINDVNIIKSIHGRTSINNYINNLLKINSKIIYINKIKIQSLINDRKVQYPDTISSASINNNTINSNMQ